MARIPAQQVEQLKNEVPVERLIEAAGVALKKSGKDKIGRCPFHEDGEPSLVVTPAKNLWHCFGCQIGGGPIDWVMKVNNITFRKAVEMLRGDSSLAATEGVSSAAAPVPPVSPAPPVPPVADGNDQELLNQSIAFYHETFLQAPEGVAYLAKRGLKDPEMFERFKLGYANRTLGLRLPERRVKAGAQVKERLAAVGILRESGHEHFNGCIVVPVIDEAGNVTEVYGRKVAEQFKPGSPKHLYLPGPHRGVWNETALRLGTEIILCESLLDALTFWQAGYHNVTASYGVSGFIDEHLAAFVRHGTKRVLIAYDRDDAGEAAAVKLAAQLMAAGIDCYRIQFPKGMDANSYACNVTPAAKSLGVLIRKAKWMGQGVAPQAAPGELVETFEVAPVAPAVVVSPLAAVSAPANVKAPELEPSPAQPEPSPAQAEPSPEKTEPSPEKAEPSPEKAEPAPATAAVPQPESVPNPEPVFTFGERRYRVRGLAKNLSPETLKINLLVSMAEPFYVDTLDLYNAKSRNHYVQWAAKELGVKEELIKHDLGRILLKLEVLQEERIRAAVKPANSAPPMGESDRAAALALLRSPNLMERVLADFDACGLVGEHTNKVIGYLAAVSRKLDRPLAIVVQSSSAAGKSSLMDAVLAMMPEEERIKYSAMTGQSLFYMGETNLQHKILAIVEEEGASRASYALKLLQSEGELTIATTGKDPVTGVMTTQQYKVSGPVMLFLTTTAIELDEELMNRCVVLAVDEGREQTQAIHALQRNRRTLTGLITRQNRDAVLNLHRNAQRLLRPLAVVNPFADQLTFLSDKTRTRRDHEKYLTLIDTIALLHQHQRPVKSASDGERVIEYIEATREDVRHANRLAHEVLGRSTDELPPQTRRLLVALAAYVSEQMAQRFLPRNELRFSRADLRAATSWGDTQLKLHLSRLAELEYVLVHRAERGQSYVYELVYDGDGNAVPHLSGLLHV